MIRLAALSAFVAVLCIYAWRNWFVSLCGLLLLTTLSQHPDMPHAVLGVSGLNPWNLVLGVVFAVWLIQRRPGPHQLPRWFLALFLSYVGLLVVGGIRAMMDAEVMVARGVFPGQTALLFDLILNPLKYLLVGVLFCDGCRTQRRAWLGIHTLLLLGLLHALMMYKTMKGMVFVGNYEDARRMTDKMIGLHANDLAGLLTFAFWSALVYAMVAKGKWKWAAITTAVVILPTIVGCYSRAAFVANGGLALALGLLFSRKLLICVPIGVLAVVLLFPNVATRLSMGFESDPAYATGEMDWNEVTAGRTEGIWAPTVEQIGHSPLIGHGRLAIWRTDCYEEILAREGSAPAHPHNSYLEILLDSGLIGLATVVGLLVVMGWIALPMLRSRRDKLTSLTGGLGLVAMVNVLILALSSNFFYPKESLLWLICTIALAIRVRSSRALLQTNGAPPARRSVGQLIPNRNVPLRS